MLNITSSSSRRSGLLNGSLAPSFDERNNWRPQPWMRLEDPSGSDTGNPNTPPPGGAALENPSDVGNPTMPPPDGGIALEDPSDLGNPSTPPPSGTGTKQ